MRRRDFISAPGAIVAVLPLAAGAQQPAAPVIGYLTSITPAADVALAAAFRESLEASGFTEGRNVAIEYRYAEGDYDRLPALAADLVARNVDVIIARSLPSALAGKAATSRIPIVFRWVSIRWPLGW